MKGYMINIIIIMSIMMMMMTMMVMMMIWLFYGPRTIRAQTHKGPICLTSPPLGQSGQILSGPSPQRSACKSPDTS